MSLNKQNSDTMQVEIVELAHSINQIVEKFRLLQLPLTESHEKVPQATEQLDKISEQTEAATHRMLDRIEAITSREQEIIEGLKGLKTSIGESASEQISAELIELQNKADHNCNDAYVIMDALQFQDITSQQINHAASLLEEIEVKLHSIICVLSGGESISQEAVERKERFFDPDADLLSSKTEQVEIDSLFEKNSTKK